ncbi:MAG: 3'(2'),5'-bisphosphate nucleotidase [Anaerolineae bacterium]|nr:3'(2'),5'-bisphosphate nucleotidase [Anaerolineae bacterium]
MDAILLHTLKQCAALTTAVQTHFLDEAHKAGREPVTIADYGSQAILCRMLAQEHPVDAVIAEEQAADFLAVLSPEQRGLVARFVSQTLGIAAEEAQICAWLDHGRGLSAARTWVIDPIDGTKGFLARRHYTIALGLLEHGTPVFGALACPAYTFNGARGTIFYGGRDEVSGAHSLAGNPPTPIGVSLQADPSLARGLESVESGHTAHDILATIRAQLNAPPDAVVRMDGQDKYAAVACGDAEYYLRLSPDANRKERVWDHAAGAALVAAAGGRVTDLDGRPLDFSLGQTLAANRGIIASNGRLHDAILAAVRQAGA